MLACAFSSTGVFLRGPSPDASGLWLGASRATQKHRRPQSRSDSVPYRARSYYRPPCTPYGAGRSLLNVEPHLFSERLGVTGHHWCSPGPGSHRLSISLRRPRWPRRYEPGASAARRRELGPGGNLMIISESRSLELAPWHWHHSNRLDSGGRVTEPYPAA